MIIYITYVIYTQLTQIDSFMNVLSQLGQNLVYKWRMHAGGWRRWKKQWNFKYSNKMVTYPILAENIFIESYWKKYVQKCCSNIEGISLAFCPSNKCEKIQETEQINSIEFAQG